MKHLDVIIPITILTLIVSVVSVFGFFIANEALGSWREVQLDNGNYDVVYCTRWTSCRAISQTGTSLEMADDLYDRLHPEHRSIQRIIK